MSRNNRDPLHHEHFDEIADLEVVEPLEADAALESGLDLANIVLEAAQRPDLAFVDDDVVAKQPRVRIARASDAPLADHAAGDGAVLRNFERIAHLGDPTTYFLVGQLEMSLQRRHHPV